MNKEESEILKTISKCNSLIKEKYEIGQIWESFNQDNFRELFIVKNITTFKDCEERLAIIDIILIKPFHSEDKNQEFSFEADEMLELSKKLKEKLIQ